MYYWDMTGWGEAGQLTSGSHWQCACILLSTDLNTVLFGSFSSPWGSYHNAPLQMKKPWFRRSCGQLPEWLPSIPAPWHSCPCIIPIPGVWALPWDLLLANRIRQKWRGVTSEIRSRKDCHLHPSSAGPSWWKPATMLRAALWESPHSKE